MRKNQGVASRRRNVEEVTLESCSVSDRQDEDLEISFIFATSKSLVTSSSLGEALRMKV